MFQLPTVLLVRVHYTYQAVLVLRIAILASTKNLWHNLINVETFVMHVTLLVAHVQGLLALIVFLVKQVPSCQIPNVLQIVLHSSLEKPPAHAKIHAILVPQIVVLVLAHWLQSVLHAKEGTFSKTTNVFQIVV